MTTESMNDLILQTNDLILRSFDQHVDGLEVAVRSHGVTVTVGAHLSDTEVVMVVSPLAYAALMKRARSAGASTIGTA